jgi:alkylation response protein AidB-like acyl-CoA dehydrogenase
VRRDLEDVVEWLRAHGRANDPLARRRIADLAVEADEVEVHALQVLDAMLKGRPAVVAAAISKVAHTLACQNIAMAAMELGAQAALIIGERPELLWRISLWETIGGGTTEVMRGVIARQGLGLGGGS